MNRVIAVSPTDLGWTLRLDRQEGALSFASGAEAETAARRLAFRLAHAGQASDILIYLRDGSLAGQLRSTPQDPAARPRDATSPNLERAAAA